MPQLIYGNGTSLFCPHCVKEVELDSGSYEEPIPSMDLQCPYCGKWITVNQYIETYLS